MKIVKRALVVATATIAASVALAAAPATAGITPTTEGPGESATLTITKVVQGDAPADASFTIVVDCENTGSEELVFDATGGSESLTFFGPDECDITEPDDGGASSTTGLGSVQITEPTAYAITVVNSFDPDTSSSSSTTADVDADSATRPTFTG